jgi:hypothetical protein
MDCTGNPVAHDLLPCRKYVVRFYAIGLVANDVIAKYVLRSKLCYRKLSYSLFYRPPAVANYIRIPSVPVIEVVAKCSINRCSKKYDIVVEPNSFACNKQLSLFSCS